MLRLVVISATDLDTVVGLPRAIACVAVVAGYMDDGL